MQVNSPQRIDTLTQHKRRLADLAQKDRSRAQELEARGQGDLSEAQTKREASSENRQKGEQLGRESDRLRRNGREQSLRGLHRLADGSDRYAESFRQQEKGLGDLQSALTSIQAAGAIKSEATEKINSGLSEQVAHNQSQAGDLGQLEGSHQESAGLLEQKFSSADSLAQNVESRTQTLNSQTERVADFLLADSDFEQGAAVKSQAFDTMVQGVEHRVKAEGLNDAKSHQELKANWAEEDAARHDGSNKRLYFDSLFESLKAQTAKLNAAFHETAAQKGELKAGDLQSQASQMKAQAESCFQQARMLEHSGHQHIAVGRQMKCCPWTYCQGVALEQQGFAELARAQELKSQATQMRAQAQEKSVEAETARVKAEQAREVSLELEVKGHGSEVRSDILLDRSDAHGEEAEKAEQRAISSAAEVVRLEQAAKGEYEQARALRKQASTEFRQGVAEQAKALGKQGQAVVGFKSSLASEAELQGEAKTEIGNLSTAVKTGRSFLGRSGSLVQKIRNSVDGERDSQGKVQSGIDEFKTGLGQSVESSAKAQEAADLLEQARELELEGLRLQNRGQKMLLEARPKMAQAAHLSAQSFDAYKLADKQEEQAETLIRQGNEKISAASILRDKAKAYQSLAETA